MNHTTILEPLPDTATLDGERADHFGTFLSVEAAADAASTRSAIRSPRRRALVGLAAATVLAGGLLAVNGVVGGPGPAAVDPAVAIEQANGWTTISITDPDATPAEIEAALDAAGIDARVEAASTLAGPMSGGSTADPVSVYFLPVTTGDPSADDHHAFYTVASFDGAGHGDLSALGVEFALPAHFTEDESEAWTIARENEAGAEPPSHLGEAMADAGVRTGGDLPEGTVSIKDGSDVEIVLYAG